MARTNFQTTTFNRGRISRLGLARTDLDRTRMSAETQTNWVPRTLGSMMLRPGFQYIGQTLNQNKGRPIPFVFSSTDTALVEVTASNVRVWVDDALIERVGSTSAVSGGIFTSTGLLGWTDADETGSTSEWVSGDYMGLTGTRFNRAIRRQQITAAAQSHGLAITVARGRPVIKVGSSSAGEDYLEETTLRPGNYSFKITSTGDFWVEFSANTEYASLINTVAIESSGDMTISAPWASTDLDNLRWKQSGDVIFLSAYGIQQRRIERHATESWAVVLYDLEDGPFRNINITNKQLTPSAKTGNITLSCDQPLFKSGHVGALFQVTSVGQEVDVTVTAANQWSDPIRVSGVEDGRKFQIEVTSATSTSNTIRVQRSVGEIGNWSNVSGLEWTSTINSTHDDSQDNQIIFYRLGSGTTDIGSTNLTALTGSLSYAAGGITGTAHIVSVVSATESSAIVFTAFGSTTPSELWSEGDWSDERGWPSAVTLHEGRLCWAGKAKLWLSVSDAFESFDQDTEGDSGPLNRSIGQGPVDTIEWLISLSRLIIGSQGSEMQAKTSSLEEPLTPTNFSLRDISTQGSAGVQAVQVDRRAYFVQAGGVRVFEVNVPANSLDFESLDRTIIIPEMGEPAIVKMAVQRQPDTRLHCVRSDGTVALLVTDPAENVLCWIDIETGDADGINGVIEDVAVLPGTVEDAVYYLVKRMINGGTVRYWEKWAMESEARGGQANKQADSFLLQESTSTTLVSGLDHLVGESVIAWGDGKDLGTYTVSSTGEITLSMASSSVVVGLPYTALFKSAKLAYAASAGTALAQRKRIDHVGVILADTHAQGLQFGPSTSDLDPLPRIELSAVVSTDAIHTDYDYESIPFPGNWDTDSRLVLYASAPRPCTVLGAVITIETKDKI